MTGAYLKIYGHCRNLLVVSLVAVAEVTAVRQIKGHDALVRLQNGSVHLEIGGRA